MNVLGVEFTPDVRGWSDAQRRVGSLLAIGAAALLVLVGLVTYAFAREAAAILYWVLVVLVALVLAYEVVVLVFGLKAERAAPGAHKAAAAAADGSAGAAAVTPRVAEEDAQYARPEPATPRPAAQPSEEDFSTLTLRCGDCGTVFDVTDTGERPLYHSCPGCGAEGVLREPAAAAPATPAAAPTAATAPEPATPRPTGDVESQWARGGEGSDAPAFEPPASAAPAVAAEPVTPAPVVKRLKLRCGGCKQVFSLDDTGQRPLESRCAHCGRKGIIR